jgi:hypothetical protein
MGRREAEEFYDDHIDDYYDARDFEFDQQFKEFMQDFKRERITEEDIEGFVEAFSFPDEDEWIANELESFIGECADRAYEDFKERRAGLC